MDMDEATANKQKTRSVWRSQRAEENKEKNKTCEEFLSNGATTERFDSILVSVTHDLDMVVTFQTLKSLSMLNLCCLFHWVLLSHLFY